MYTLKNLKQIKHLLYQMAVMIMCLI